MRKNLFDMHIHSNYSDGEFSPDELIKLAEENNITTMAITDHDTLLGVKNITYKPNNIQLIPGIELSAKTDKGRMHILGYNIDIDNKELNDKMDELKDNSLNSFLSILVQLKKDYNITFKYNDIKELVNSNHNLGRPDIAKLCIKYNLANTVDDAFKKYLNPAYEKCRHSSKGISYKECINLILSSGGIPVLAHPKTLKLEENELRKLIKEMIDIGLKGIEVYHSSHTEEEKNLYLKIADDFGLYISGGSDFHGPIAKPTIKLGSGENNNLNLEYLSIMKLL